MEDLYDSIESFKMYINIFSYHVQRKSEPVHRFMKNMLKKKGGSYPSERMWGYITRGRGAHDYNTLFMCLESR